MRKHCLSGIGYGNGGAAGTGDVLCDQGCDRGIDALARGKRDYDKRQAIAERDAKREADRALKGIRE